MGDPKPEPLAESSPDSPPTETDCEMNAVVFITLGVILLTSVILGVNLPEVLLNVTWPASIPLDPSTGVLYRPGKLPTSKTLGGPRERWSSWPRYLLRRLMT